MSDKNRKFRIVVYGAGFVVMICVAVLSFFAIKNFLGNAPQKKPEPTKSIEISSEFNTFSNETDALSETYASSQPNPSEHIEPSDSTDSYSPEVSPEVGTTEEDTLRSNHLKKSKKLYNIKYGDTLCEISKKTGFSVDSLAEKNDIRDVNKIYAGSVLVLPDN